MNKLERVVYDLVKSNPKLKDRIRNIYQTFFDCLPAPKDNSIYEITEKKGYFFGFHDITPFSYDEKYILSNKLQIPLQMPTVADKLSVGIWKDNFTVYEELDTTLAWNYHKGCRLQWCGSRTYDVIYNAVIDKKLCSIIRSIDKADNIKIIDYPIDTVSYDGYYATSFSYERLNRYMPGYGYEHKDASYFDNLAPSDTGIFIIDLKNNTSELIISLEELSMIEPDETMVGACHFVTHTEFSPDNQRVAFLHRWTHDDPNKRYTRLVTCKIDGSDIFISKTSGMVSHFVWDKLHGILTYAQIDGIDGHYIFSDYKLKDAKRVASKINSDGHQTFIPGCNKFITDTYPDKFRQAALYMCDIDTEDIIILAKLKSPKKYQSPNINKHWACDLHPRCSPLGNYVSFDSVHNNERSFCIMPLNFD